MLNNNNWRLWIWKKNSLFNLINEEPDIDKNYLYAKDPYGSNFNFLLTKEKVRDQIILMILKYLLNTQMIQMTFIKKLKNSIEIRNAKY